MLTIGIPTFNRKQIVKSNVSDILSDYFLLENNIDLIVSDNHSSDGTFDDLLEIKEKSLFKEKLIFTKNSSNVGVFKNIFKLFELCKSDYLLVTSDEDFVIKENIKPIAKFLSKKKPTFVSPQFFTDGKLYRGSTRTRLISYSEWEEAGFFASGLIFDVKQAKHIINIFLICLLPIIFTTLKT